MLAINSSPKDYSKEFLSSEIGASGSGLGASKDTFASETSSYLDREQSLGSSLAEDDSYCLASSAQLWTVGFFGKVCRVEAGLCFGRLCNSASTQIFRSSLAIKLSTTPRSSM